jgi:hypothetical protein
MLWQTLSVWSGTWHFANGRAGSVIIPMQGCLVTLYQLQFRSHYALGFTQPLTEMSTRSREIMFMGSKVRQVRKADNLTAIYEPIV